MALFLATFRFGFLNAIGFIADVSKVYIFFNKWNSNFDGLLSGDCALQNWFEFTRAHLISYIIITLACHVSRKREGLPKQQQKEMFNACRIYMQYQPKWSVNRLGCDLISHVFHATNRRIAARASWSNNLFALINFGVLFASLEIFPFKKNTGFGDTLHSANLIRNDDLRTIRFSKWLFLFASFFNFVRYNQRTRRCIVYNSNC